MPNKIKITATRSILVTSGLDYNDYSTDKNVNVDAKWLKDAVMIHAGQHEYDAKIANWPSVKALVNQGVLTIAALPSEERTGRVAKAKTEETETVKVEEK